MLGNSLQNKKIIISAGASGIGWATAKVCLSRGATVYLCDIDNKSVSKLNKHPLKNKRLFAYECDASDEYEVSNFFNQVYKKTKKIDTEKAFFISTEIVADEDTQQSMEFPICSEAHDIFFNTGRTEHHMNWSQIEEIYNTPNCTVGGHSHSHQRISNEPKLIMNDTRRMMRTFKDKLKYKPDTFCFPYNMDTGIYRGILTAYGFNKFYSSERIAIEDI